jgi:hypothetical protein
VTGTASEGLHWNRLQTPLSQVLTGTEYLKPIFPRLREHHVTGSKDAFNHRQWIWERHRSRHIEYRIAVLIHVNQPHSDRRGPVAIRDGKENDQ